MGVTMHLTPAEGQTDEEITTRHIRNLRSNLRATNEALELLL
jgi:hypothetical protein